MNTSKNCFFRLAEGIFLVALFAAALFFAYSEPVGVWLFASMIILFPVMAAWELGALLMKKGIALYTPLLLLGGSLYLYTHTAVYLFPHAQVLPKLALLLFLLALGWNVIRSKQEVLSSVISTVFGFVYLFLPTQLLLDMTYQTSSMGSARTRWWLIWALVCIKGSDIIAYGIGRKIGKRPLTAISPKKTWEGFHAGWLGGALCSLFMGYMPGHPDLSGTLFFILGAILALLAILGDLIESRFKREVHIKDSSLILPGLGGFLDVADSLLFATPFAYVCFRYIGAA